MDKKMKKRIENMASKTWDAIGGDVLKMIEDTEGKPRETAIMPREHVMEIVADADYMQAYGGDEEAYETWKKLPTYEEMLEAIKGAFPYENYGW